MIDVGYELLQRQQPYITCAECCECVYIREIKLKLDGWLMNNADNN